MRWIIEKGPGQYSPNSVGVGYFLRVLFSSNYLLPPHPIQYVAVVFNTFAFILYVVGEKFDLSFENRELRVFLSI